MYFVFDAYGTLLDVNAAAREAAQEPEMAVIGDQWQSISTSWREKQLRYSWLCSMMGRYDDFWSLTMRALDSTLEEHGLLSNVYVRERLLALYGRLSAFDEVSNVLAKLKQNHIKTAVFSNASPNMLAQALSASQLDQYIDELISVDLIKKYKPAPEAYELVTNRFSCMPEEIIFFSSNNWDVSGACSFGFKTVWVNRMGINWDNLPGSADIVCGSIAEGLEALKA